MEFFLIYASTAAARVMIDDVHGLEFNEKLVFLLGKYRHFAGNNGVGMTPLAQWLLVLTLGFRILYSEIKY